MSKRPFVTRSQRELDVKALREHRVVTAASIADAAAAGVVVSLGGMIDFCVRESTADRPGEGRNSGSRPGRVRQFLFFIRMIVAVG
jgi:hypothetical protein